MQIPTETYARFLPDYLIARHRLDPAPPADAHAQRYRGAVLMADIMGYTALTERYSRRPEGVEELKTLINDFFGRLNALILGHGGDIISFAGDSVFALWCGDDVAALHAAQCALAAQQALDGCDLGEGLFLRMRMVVAAGELTVATVGGHAGKWECLATGSPLASIGAGLQQSEPGAVVLDPHALHQLGVAVDADPLRQGYAKLLRLRADCSWPATAPSLPEAMAAAALRCYIAKPVLEQLDAGLSDWLAEFRRATTLFIRINGIDYAHDDALASLHATTLTVQAAVDRYEGTFHRVIVDDKGTNMLCVWGIPGRAHEDDAVRALSAGFAIRKNLQEAGYTCGIGITTGRVMCGLSGGGRRYEYTVAGDAVNLAARLMVAADGGMLCDATTAESARGVIECEALAPIQVKGRDEPLAVFRPRALKASAGKVAPPRSHFLGRRSEMAQLRATLDALRAGSAAVMTIEGEPGVGKSQLVAEFQREATAGGIGFLLGHADAIERGTTYYAWREILRRILELRGARDNAQQRRCFETMCADAPAVGAWLPLLNDVLPLGFAETATTRRMSEQARAEGTLELLLHVLQQAIAAQPMVIVLEDAHWLDSMSWLLAARLHAREGSLLLVLVTRSGHAPEIEEGRDLLALAAARRIDLATFSREDTAALVCDRLRVTSLPEELLSLIYERTDGHPLFSEELAYSLRDSEYLIVRDGRCLIAGGDASVDARNLPATVEGIIAGRVDRLGAGEQLTLKIASVLGRGFSARALCDVHPMQPGDEAIARQLDSFVALDLVHAQPAGGGADFEFKHIITQEVTYGLLAYAQRRAVHRAAAGWLERAHAADPGVAYPLLAHHWSRAGDPPQAFRFLHLAGAQAFRRHANREAAAFLQEALAQPFAPSQQPAPALRAECERILGFSWLWLGHIERSDPHIRNSLALLGHRMPETRLELAAGIAAQLVRGVFNHFLRRRFIAGAEAAMPARADIVESLIRYSHIAWFRSDILLNIYTSLRTLNMAERMPQSAETALVYSALAVGVGAIPLHGLARRYRDLALEAAGLINEPAISAQALLFVSLYQGGLGDWDICLERVARAEQLAREIGDFRRAEECMVITGYIKLHAGDIAAALRSYETAAQSARRRGDRQTTGWGYLGIARVSLVQGRPEAALAALAEAAPSVADRLGGVESHGLSALAYLQTRQFEQAWQAAGAGLRLLRESPPVSFTTLSGTAGVAECLIALKMHARRGVAVDRIDVIEREARRALGLLRRFARIFPVGRPRWLLQQGNYALAAGDLPRALNYWRQSAAAAATLAMPYDEALASLAIARCAGGAAGTAAHVEAAALFERLGLPEPASVLP